MTSNKTITVEIDCEVASIVPEFLDNRRRDCRYIANLLDANDFGEIRTLGHRMKGAGGSYGFDDISDIGEAIEKAALVGDKAVISRQILLLADYLERVEVVYI